MNFEEYCEDILDQHVALMSEEQRAQASKGFEEFQNGAQKRRTQLNDKALDARSVAKLFGGKALTGTKKQKEWAEKIRAEKLRGMTDKQAILASAPDGLLTSSKFWIENRSASAADIGNFVEQQKALLNKYKDAKANGDHESVSEIAPQYNALTAKWGF